MEIIGRGPKITVDAGGSLKLECTVKDAKPVATVAWYKNNQLIRAGQLFSYLIIYQFRYLAILIDLLSQSVQLFNLTSC